MSYNDLVKLETLEDFQPKQWLEQNARRDMAYVLAHTDEGVLWGRIENGQLHWAGDAFPELSLTFQLATLQQVRLFGPAGEVFIWRTPTGQFQARRLEDGATAPTQADTFEDQQWLWGTLGEKGQENKELGFTLLVEGKQGLRHAPPITGLRAKERVMLTVRHYIETDLKTDNNGEITGTGLACIIDSRLLDVRRAEN